MHDFENSFTLSLSFESPSSDTVLLSQTPDCLGGGVIDDGSALISSGDDRG